MEGDLGSKRQFFRDIVNEDILKRSRLVCLLSPLCLYSIKTYTCENEMVEFNFRNWSMVYEYFERKTDL
jgi:hypothetical protein